VQADLFDPDAVARAVAAAGPSLRALVNLVGGFAIHGRVHETPVETFEEQLRLNLRPAYLACAAALPVMLQAGGGAIVCVSSRAARQPFPGAAGYIVGKAAVLALVDALDAEYRKDGVRINAVLPSVIDTPANRASMSDADFDTWVRPEQIAHVIRFLCSDDASVTSGAHLPVYGLA
jgi:NAD(P)-dependent dehydrogenase (short-subunit alcohol dehydrogenase family)